MVVTIYLLAALRVAALRGEPDPCSAVKQNPVTRRTVSGMAATRTMPRCRRVSCAGSSARPAPASPIAAVSGRADPRPGRGTPSAGPGGPGVRAADGGTGCCPRRGRWPAVDCRGGQGAPARRAVHPDPGLKAVRTLVSAGLAARRRKGRPERTALPLLRASPSGDAQASGECTFAYIHIVCSPPYRMSRRQARARGRPGGASRCCRDLMYVIWSTCCTVTDVQRYPGISQC
jgi:hypothetical protein